MKSFLRESYIGSRAVGRSENSGGHDLLTPLVEIGLTVISKKNYLGGGAPSLSTPLVPTALGRYQTLMMPGTRALWIIRIFISRVHNSIRIFDREFSQVGQFACLVCLLFLLKQV